MKLYTVSVAYETLVWAENEREACKHASDCVADGGLDLNDCATARPVRSYQGQPVLPADWEERSLVYGDHKGDLSVAEAFAASESEQVPRC